VAERLARRLARRRLRSLNRSHAELRASAFARDETGAVHETGASKPERLMASPHGTDELDTAGRNVFNLCANYCLGLADDPRVVAAAEKALREWGYGMASVRFTCGTQTIHRDLEERLAEFRCAEVAVLFGCAFDANGGVFEVLLDQRDTVNSAALNHASIIDARSSSCSSSGRGPTCSPTRSHRPWSRRRWRCCGPTRYPRICASACTRRRRGSARAWHRGFRPAAW